MDQTAIQPDFMPHTSAGPQSGFRMSDGSLIMGSVKPHRAENLMAVRQKPSFINGHRWRLENVYQAFLDLNQARLTGCFRPRGSLAPEPPPYQSRQAEKHESAVSALPQKRALAPMRPSRALAFALDQCAKGRFISTSKRSYFTSMDVLREPGTTSPGISCKSKGSRYESRIGQGLKGKGDLARTCGNV